MPYQNLKIATRQSQLALHQANVIKQQLLYYYPKLEITLVPLTTSGDKFIDVHLATIGGKGLFVKELEQAILSGAADMAVHSMKDVPNTLPAPLEIAVICARTEPRDALVSVKYASLIELPYNATVGTSSLRRQCQLKSTRPDLMIKPLRGNIDTRVKKLMQGEFDAIVLAAAGLQRLQLAQYITQYFTIDQLLPAAGQGALGIECRSDDHQLKELLSVLGDPISTQCITAERSLTALLGGSCQVPLAAYCDQDELKQLSLRAMVGSEQGDIMLYGHLKAPWDQPEQLGAAVAASLLSQGADLILRPPP